MVMSNPHPLETVFVEEFKETLDRIEKAVDDIILESKLPTKFTGRWAVSELVREGISNDWRPEETMEAYRLEIEREKQLREKSQREYEQQRRITNKFRVHLQELTQNNITDCQCELCMIK